MNQRIRAAAAVIGGLSVLAADPSLAQVSAYTDPDSQSLTPPGFGSFVERVYGKLPADAPPPTADPRDFNGVWVPEGMIAAYAAGPGSTADADTPAYMACVPESQIGGTVYGGQVFQTPKRITFIAEYNHTLRRVYLNEGFPPIITPTYAGYSIGHWDGSTLVIETRGLKPTRYQGSTQLASISHVLERVRKVDGGRVLEHDASVEGPDATGALRTVQIKWRQVWRPDVRLREYICEQGAGLFFDRGGAK